jgi:polyferredoxin
VNGQVVAAYSGYWQALGQALDARNAVRARAILVPYASSALITSLVSGLETDWARGEIQYGAPVPHILSVQVTGDRATVHDCADFSHAGVQTTTGQVVGSLGDPRVNMISILVLSDGRWLLNNQVPVVASCSP